MPAPELPFSDSLQGGFEAHAKALARARAPTRARCALADDLEGLDALVIPGGESTTIGLGVEREGLAEPLIDFARSGKPVLGTCAGMIMLDREHLGLLDIERPAQRVRSPAGVVRGRARPSTASRSTPSSSAPPGSRRSGDGVEVLAEVDGHPVAVRQGNILAVAFHPELGSDRTLARWLVDRVRAA